MELKDSSQIERPPFPNMFYTQFALPYDPTASECNLRILKEYIGKEGYNFIKLTNVKRAKYIWYAKEINAVEVYAKTTKIIARVVSGLKKLLADTVLRIFTSQGQLYFEPTLLEWCADIWRSKFPEKSYYIVSKHNYLNLEMFMTSLLQPEKPTNINVLFEKCF